MILDPSALRLENCVGVPKCDKNNQGEKTLTDDSYESLNLKDLKKERKFKKKFDEDKKPTWGLV